MSRAAGRRKAALALATVALAAAAQVPGGGRRSRGESRDGQPEGMPGREGQARRPLLAADPVFAIEHELPSLRADLALAPAQAALWGPFERSLRDAAELARGRTKKLLAPRPAGTPAPDAPGFVAALAEDDRLRAETMADAAARLKTLYASLTPAQRSLVDRRVWLAQSDPLGTQ